MIEDIRGYKPHTEEKIDIVNSIKDKESELGKLFIQIESKIEKEIEDITEYEYDNDDYIDRYSMLHEYFQQIKIAKERLKEASMWACRSVFRPKETY